MDKINILFVFMILFAIYLIYSCNNNITVLTRWVSNQRENFDIYNRNILEPNINGKNTTDYNTFNGKRNDIDPSDYYENNGYLVAKEYDNLMISNFDNNTKRSLALSSVKEIFNDTKNILNGTNKDIKFNYFGVKELKANYDDYKLLLNIIFDSINANANDYFLIKPYKLNKIKLYRNENKYLFNIDISCDVTNTNDEYNKENAKMTYDFDKLHYDDTLTNSNPLKINAIIQFIIEINNNYNIYIKNLSVLSNID
jgi:hypothetical protein